jgi:hypothetical protein
MVEYARRRGSVRFVERYQRDADEAESAANVLRRYLTAGLPMKATEETG